MDKTVIEEIAKQLGMAVDSTGQFIQEILPQYAGMKAVSNATWAIAFLVIMAVLVVFALKSLKAYREIDREEYRSIWGYERDKEDYFWKTAVPLFVATLLLLFACDGIIQALSWTLFPDAKLLDMAIEAIQD